jgi:hypothetical protein
MTGNYFVHVSDLCAYIGLMTDIIPTSSLFNNNILVCIIIILNFNMATSVTVLDIQPFNISDVDHGTVRFYMTLVAYKTY